MEKINELVFLPSRKNLIQFTEVLMNLEKINSAVQIK